MKTEQLTFELLTVAERPRRILRHAPDDSGKWYQAWTLDTDEGEAAQAFESKFGYPPDEIQEVAGVLMLGPVW
jgi:hypothetical protein